MSDAKPQQEPSMEEILASIRRIIAEDERPAEPAAAPASEAGDVLELTEAINDDGSVRRVAPPVTEPPPTAVPAPMPPAVAGRIEPEPARAAAEADIAMLSEPAPPRADLPGEGGSDRILSSISSDAAAAAFARLATVPRERRRDGDIRVGAGDRTLEDVVRDVLRPLLQTWLDDNLPDLVERLVRAEIARVVGEAGLR